MILTTRRHGAEWLAFGLVFMAVFSELRFFTTAGSTGNVEQWVNLTNAVFYGKQDFLFSYGPLFWLIGGATSLYNLGAYWASIVFISTVEAFFWAIVVSLSFRNRGYLLLAAAFFLFFDSLVLPCAYFLWPLALIAYLEFSQPDTIKLKGRWLLVLGAIVGFSLYVRFFYGTVAIITLGSYYTSRALVTRKLHEIALLAVGGVLGYIAVGLLIFHQASSLVDYFIINSQLNFGNSVDMTLDIDNARSTFIGAALVLLFLNIFVLSRKRILFLTINALVIVLFKIGFSRSDHYIAYFLIPAAATACIMLFDGSWKGKTLFVLTLAVLYHIATHPGFPGAPTKNALKAGVDYSTPYQQRMANTYASFKLPDSVVAKIGHASLDVYPYNNEYAFANGLNYVHRPLFQNYMTLTPKLDGMNQKFFESQARPDFVLWTAGIACGGKDCNPFEGFDQKYALNEDPLTVSALLQNYHVVEQFPARNGIPAALLQQNATRTPYSERALSSVPMKFDQWYSVPAAPAGVVRLKPNLKFTIAGRLRNMLFRGAVLKVRYRLESGEIREFRTNILNASSGIWVSPLLQNFQLEGPRVQAVMLTTRYSGYFQPEFQGDWVVVPIETVRTASIKFDEQMQIEPASSDAANQNAGVCDGSIDAADGTSPVAARLSTSGPLRLQGWLAASAKDGVRFDKTLVMITSASGEEHFYQTHEQDRPDVANVFGKPDLRESGFESLIDNSTLNGDYTVGMAGIRDGRVVRCTQFKIPLSAH
jgi:hypothetical protein